MNFEKLTQYTFKMNIIVIKSLDVDISKQTYMRKTKVILIPTNLNVIEKSGRKVWNDNPTPISNKNKTLISVLQNYYYLPLFFV